MSSFRNNIGRLWDYVSPRKTRERRDKPFKAPALPTPLKDKTLRKTSPEMDVDSKLDRWDGKAAASASEDHTFLPPSPPSSISRNEDVEIEPLIHDSVEDEPEDDRWDANEETLVLDDSEFLEKQKPIDREKEMLALEAQAISLRKAGWEEDALFLFQKLNSRGFEPLFLERWVNDFATLPVDLFTFNEEQAFIKPDGGSDFRAQHALERLFMLGGLTRDAVLMNAPKRTPEFHISQAVKNYSTWAMQDVGMRHTWNNLTLFSVVFCSRTTPSYVAEQKMANKLFQLREQWTETLEASNANDLGSLPQPPTLYGVIASHTVMAFVSYILSTPTNPKGSLRTIAIFDFSQEGYDVWNSLAIAIFVVHCRNRMKELQESLPTPVVAQVQDEDL